MRLIGLTLFQKRDTLLYIRTCFSSDAKMARHLPVDKKLTDSLPRVRCTPEHRRRVRQAARQLGVTDGELIRLATEEYLPRVERGEVGSLEVAGG
jgi:hypothetical protein